MRGRTYNVTFSFRPKHISLDLLALRIRPFGRHLLISQLTLSRDYRYLITAIIIIQSLSVWGATPKFKIGWLDNNGNSINDQATILFDTTVINVLDLGSNIPVTSYLRNRNVLDSGDLKSALTVDGHS